MKCLTFILALCFATFTHGQSVEKMASLLKEKDFTAVKNFVDDHPRSNVDIRWEILRDILPGFQEGVINMVETPLYGRDTGYTIRYYQVRFLSTESTIFSYVFDFSNGMQNVNGELEYSYSTLDSFTNQQVYRQFLTAFTNTYHAKLNEKDLFVSSIVFGDACGLAGEEVEGQVETGKMLNARDLVGIRSWLRSANTEKQLYAIKAMRQLARNGYVVSGEDRAIVDVISRKKGMVKTCSGCIYSSSTIEQALKNIKGEDLNLFLLEKFSFNATGSKTGLVLVLGTLLISVISRNRKNKQIRKEV